MQKKKLKNTVLKGVQKTMTNKLVTRKILAGTKEFKTFWQENDPFKYALTSLDYPPVLLKEEEWLFSNDVVALLKELMQYDAQKMKMVKAPWNPANKAVLRPDDLSEWKIANFPEQWYGASCDIFVPEGHLTCAALNEVADPTCKVDALMVEHSFFESLQNHIEQLGYLLFKPVNGAKRAGVQSYLKEWETDEADAGLL